jgi:tRNA (guanine-N1)-methyltransferase
LLSPQGRVFKQVVAKEFADEAEHIILICGRYEGVDERVNDALVTMKYQSAIMFYQAANRQRLF